MNSFIMGNAIRSGDEDGSASEPVEEWKEEDPDDIDDVPVHPDVLGALWMQALEQTTRDDDHGDHAGDDVQSVQAGHQVVKRPEHALVGDQAGRDLVGVLVGLDHQEDEATANGGKHQFPSPLGVTVMCLLMGLDHNETAGQQHEGVQRPGPGDGVCGFRGPLHRVSLLTQDEGDDEPTKDGQLR